MYHSQPGSEEPAEGGVATPATYWRRRAFALMIGIAVIATLAWAANGTLGAPGRQSGQAGSHRGAAHTRAHAGRSQEGAAGQGGVRGAAGRRPPSAGSSRPGGGQGGAGHSRASSQGGSSQGGNGQGGSARSGDGQSGNGHQAPAHRAGHGPTGRQARGGTGPARCGPGQVVLSLFTPRYWYGHGQRPEFVVTAVSTGPRACGFSLGSLEVVISSGRTAVWSSAGCAKHPRPRMVTLARGVPAVFWFSWDRDHMLPGCHRARHPARAGTYTVTAVSGHLHSPTVLFVLSGPGVAVP